jgi:hypothetical protein
VKRLTRVVPLGLAALLLITGCDQSTGTAAKVGSDTISTHDVDLVSKALCQERAGQASAQNDTRISLALVRKQAVTALVDAQLNQQYGDQRHAFYDKATLNQQVASLKTLIDKLPADDRARTQDLITGIFRGRLLLTQIGQQQLALTGQRATSQDQALTAGLKARAAYDKRTKVELNPRYDTDGPGKGGAGSQSLSKSVSTYAKDGGASSQDPSWTAGLPANLRCG